MTTRHATQCFACVHLRVRRPDKPFTCDAFPGGIPNNIVFYGEDHRKPRRGDHGITFEQKPGQEAEVAMAEWERTNGGGSGGN